MDYIKKISNIKLEFLRDLYCSPAEWILELDELKYFSFKKNYMPEIYFILSQIDE